MTRPAESMERSANGQVPDGARHAAGRRDGGAAVLLPALALGVFAAGCGLAGAYAPPATGEVAVVFAPFTSQADAYAAVIAAGGRLINPGRFDNIVIADAPDSRFADRVRAQGALVLLAAWGLCGPTPQRPDGAQA